MRRRLTSEEMRARGDSRWRLRAAEEALEASGDGGDVEPWDGPSGQLHAALGGSGLSAREIAQRCRIHHARLSRFIRGDLDALRLLEFDLLCEMFGLSLYYRPDDPRSATLQSAEPDGAPPPNPDPPGGGGDDADPPGST